MDRTDTTIIGSAGLPGGTSPAAVPIATPSATAPVTTAAMARAYARDVVLEQWNRPGRAATEAAVIDLLLVVSELAANAVRHGGGLAGFEVTPSDGGVRLAVRDHSDVVPSAAFGTGGFPARHHGNGYGWPVIIRLAREITVERCPEGGKIISVLVPLV
ncbi:anti-sigma regulatory factor (Ser/Thr protein kinase) [Streptomyces sp. V3I8]|jgi:anti-sigma regulatory factor (Ser/Thr protein kinase)|uniref:ATP-binding protein n=1 Tax=Streptomyces sp. V3I8 TaxID=3042279 RepID=UPI002781375F|nr:ATP-binding protein [Streptomyces sp. V3I8]MDQ1040944.1 anti-sigma regulatory factor (Ser/Thr protein kinase) [Streptomyces sp. V3I8]